MVGVKYEGKQEELTLDFPLYVLFFITIVYLLERKNYLQYLL
jgi:hypothetical protein